MQCVCLNSHCHSPAPTAQPLPLFPPDQAGAQQPEGDSSWLPTPLEDSGCGVGGAGLSPVLVPVLWAYLSVVCDPSLVVTPERSRAQSQPSLSLSLPPAHPVLAGRTLLLLPHLQEDGQWLSAEEHLFYESCATLSNSTIGPKIGYSKFSLFHLLFLSSFVKLAFSWSDK